jgi:hypothetical protein
MRLGLVFVRLGPVRLPTDLQAWRKLPCASRTALHTLGAIAEESASVRGACQKSCRRSGRFRKRSDRRCMRRGKLARIQTGISRMQGLSVRVELGLVRVPKIVKAYRGDLYAYRKPS